MTVLNRPDTVGLLSNMGVSVGCALLTNGLIAVLLPRQMSAVPDSPMLPPGYVVGLVWTVLFVLMGAARWLLVRADPGGASPAARAVVWLGIVCLLYPLYTRGLKDERVGLLGAVVTLLFTLWVIRRGMGESRGAALALAPVAMWLLYASVALVGLVRG